MSSIEYAEAMGLRIALSNLKAVDVTYQDEQWIAVTDWIRARISELEKK
jgi:hypothetical protein